MKNIIPYGRQNITEEDIKAVISALKSDFITQGPIIKEFEEAFASYIGSRYAVAVANGTAALHLSALALDVNVNTKVITTPITFAASANCIRYCNGEVHFVDIDQTTYLLDLNKVEDLLRKKPKGYFHGIVPVDFAGRAINIEDCRLLVEKYGLQWILEDACHAPGGYFIDSNKIKQNCGNGNFADLAIFSFHPVKHIACGEGGMITTNNERLYMKLLDLRTHGITKDAVRFLNPILLATGSFQAEEYPGWYMEMQSLGYNYRLTDFQAALGLSQLARADEGLMRRKEIADIYKQAFENKSYIKSQSGVIEGHAYHLYIIEVANRLELYNYLKLKNIFSQIHYVPVHLMPYYTQFGWKEGDMYYAEEYYKNCISLPMYPTLSLKEQEYVIECIKLFFDDNV